VSQIVSQADIWLERIMLKSIRRENIIFITGNVGQGKTTFLSSVAQVLNFQGIKAGGFLSPAVFDNGTKIGYDIIGLMNGERSVISRISGSNNMARAGKYYFYEEGLEFGNKALAIENNSNSQIIIIDEIGHLELENNGWAKAMNQLLIKTDIPLILVVRNQLIEKVMKKWCFERPLMIDISSNNTEQASIIITDFLHTINTKK
jgi:iron complex transport system ATP-binding protein